MTNRDRLIELLKKQVGYTMPIFTASETIKILADYLIANGVILLPCKFLQKFFVIPTIENKFNDITAMKCIGFSLSHDSYNVNLITDKNKLYQPCFGDFGKTVFLTREQAEQALKERTK